MFDGLEDLARDALSGSRGKSQGPATTGQVVVQQHSNGDIQKITVVSLAGLHCGSKRLFRLALDISSQGSISVSYRGQESNISIQ